MPAGIPNATYRELAAQARELFPSPWNDAILDSIGRRAVIGTPGTVGITVDPWLA